MSSLTPYRQPIFPGDKGDDVLAVRHALVLLGHQLPSNGLTAGPEFVSAIERVQRNHGLHVDGRYGPTVHPIVAPHFTHPDVALYKQAALRVHYVNPFEKSTQLEKGRIDQGVDYHGVGPICAIGDAEIVGAEKTHGWPGGPSGSGIAGTYILYRLTNGRHAGRYVYVAEAVDATVSTGQHVRAGDVICTFGANAAPGGHPGIETGWGCKTMFLTYHQFIGHKNLERDTPAGAAFARLLKRLGAPVVPVDDGAEFLASYPYPDH
jgi:Putative peptidoglycan binding domain